jgi:hypothetical protein
LKDEPGSRKETLATILAVYPIFVGLYAAGFFWKLPPDLIGAFGINDFLFKASVLYAMVLAPLLLTLLMLTSIYSVIVPEDGAANPGSESPNSRFIKWSTADSSQKLSVTLASLALVGMYIWSFSGSTDPIGEGPERYVFYLLTLGMVGYISRVFADERKWKTAAVAYGFCWIIIIPVMSGFNDARVDAGSPFVRIAKHQCPVIMVGENSILAKCGNYYSILRREDWKTPLVWKGHIDQ